MSALIPTPEVSQCDRQGREASLGGVLIEGDDGGRIKRLWSLTLWDKPSVFHLVRNCDPLYLPVLGYFLGKQRQQQFVPLPVARWIKLGLGYEPSIVVDVCCVDEALHCSLHGPERKADYVRFQTQCN
jgi:hypothetical protein